jgi:transposase
MKKLTRSVTRFKGYSLGLDVHKAFIEYCVLDRHGELVDKGRIGSREDELLKLLARLKRRGPLQASLEACGCFVWIFDVLARELGRERVQVAQPSRLQVIAKSMEKNDANDAWWLAYFLHEGRLPVCFVAEGALRDLRIASRELRAYTDQRGDLLRRLKSHLAQAGLSVAKNWHTSKVRRKAAKQVIAAVSGERKTALEQLYKQSMQVTRQLRFWLVRVKELSKALPEVQRLIEEMPGVGPVVGGAVVGELGSPKRFHSAKAYAKATGLTPGYRESGGRVQGTGISRQGSAQARWAFTRAVISCLRCKSGAGLQIKQWVQERAKHKHKQKVVVAAGRKLAEGAWRLFAFGESFNLAAAFPLRAPPETRRLQTGHG